MLNLLDVHEMFTKYIKSVKDLQAGDFVNVVITDALEYDLMGVIEDEFAK